ncbi:hypothetical protein [Sulfuricurvum sp.]|uniref:hypothetical protein n=1 Tax=Sulfuricurvum sp. TaxID=2025608 RepID=UPI002636E48D|nr:hypothetical protein [Sulfuricurvum sp.]MDD2782321.1 hypothetical protein [Sulfuricurvum sp.]
MNSRNILIALALSSALYADQQPISNAFIAGMKEMKIEVKTTDAANTIEVVTPIEAFGRTYITRSEDAKDMLERQCFAYGGDVYFKIKDSFGDTLEAHSLDHAKVKALSAEQRNEYTQLKPDNKDFFIKSRSDFREFFTDKRLQRGFMFDADALRPQNFYYHTTCKSIDTGKTIYTAKTKPHPDTLVVTFSEAVATENFTKPKISKTIESLFAEYVTEQKGNKYLIKYSPFTNQIEIARAFCEEASGKLIVDGGETNIYSKPVMMKREMGCIDIEHPFVFRMIETFKYMLLTDIAPAYAKNNIVIDQSDVSDIQMQGLALSTSMLPLGAQSENNIGNRKLVSTLYSDNGMSKLVNIQEVGGNKTYKNYKVQNNEARDITDERFVYSNLKLPQSIQNAKGSLVQQCSQYGAGKVSIDGYTATCSRQAYGNQCSVNLIYIRNDQFAGREAMNCK